MPPRPIHRWKSFWLGVLFLLFLSWSWVHSMQQWSGFNYKASGSSTLWAGGNASASLYIGSLRTPIPFVELHFESEPAGISPSDRVWFPAAASFKGSDPDDWRWLNIAHWFLILVFLLPWIAFLLWRHRRMKRLTAGSTANAEHPTSTAEF